MRGIPAALIAASLLASAGVAQRAAVPTEIGPVPTTHSGGAHHPNATASYSLFGKDCGTPCAALNDKGGTLRPGTLTNEYAYGHKFAKATVIVGFQLFTKTSGLLHVSMTAALFRESAKLPGTPALKFIAQGTMTVLDRVQFYTVLLDKPVPVKAGESIWIAQPDSFLILAAGKTTGAFPALRTFWRRPPGVPKAWRPTSIILHPAWRILCAGDLAFFNTGVPKLGASMTLEMQGGPKSAPAGIFFGLRNPAASLGLCTKLFSSGEVILPRPTNASGASTFTLTVPNVPAFNGAILYNQWWAVGRAGIVGTNGGQALVGM